MEDNKKDQNLVENQPEPKAPKDETLAKVIDRIEGADSILVALSKDPNVDEISAAIGLSLMLDKMGKHVTTIYSGKTPNAVQFLEPEKTFEADTNSLQDFIIALSKEKADHLRYKIEGDFVKVYITPYKTTITEKDLEFSRGEVNVDLIISLDVTSPEDLDAALAEHGRIMHDAASVNISNAVPGRLGGVEWNKPSASSVSEMVVTLMSEMEQELSKEAATALLTGIIAATERFSNDKTSPDTMAVSSALMQAGADQQLVAAHMETKPKAEAEPMEPLVPEVEPGSVEVDSEDEAPAEPVADEPVAPEVVAEPEAEKNEPSAEEQLEQMIAGSKKEESSIMDELVKATPEVPEEPATPEAPVVAVPEVPAAPEVPVEPVAPVVSEPVASTEPVVTPEPVVPTPLQDTVVPVADPTAEQALVAAVPSATVPVDEVYENPNEATQMSEGTMVPIMTEQPKDYGAMMEEALAEPVAQPMMGAQPAQPVMGAQPVQPMLENPAAVATPVAPVQPEVQPMAAQPVPSQGGIELPPPPVPPVAATMMPEAVPSLPQVQVPEPQPVPQASILEQPTMMPEQPAQPVAPVQPEVPQDDSAALGIPATPEGTEAKPAEPVNPVVVQPVQDPTLVPPVQDPGAFKIPGM